MAEESKQKSNDSVRDLMERPIEYELESGEKMKLTMNMVKMYLVTGNRDAVTTQELMFFMQLCKARKLNPFLRECWLIKYSPSESAQIVTSIHKLRQYAMENKNCQGWNTGLIFWDAKNAKTVETRGIVLPGEYKLIGGYFEATPKTWNMPYRLEINLDGYVKKTKDGKITQFWQTEKQPTMLMKVVESQGLRNLFLNEAGQNLYIEEEIAGEHQPFDLKKPTGSETWSAPDYGGEPVKAAGAEPEDKGEGEGEGSADIEQEDLPIKTRFWNKVEVQLQDKKEREAVESFLDHLAASGKVEVETVMERALGDFDGWLTGLATHIKGATATKKKAEAEAEKKEKEAQKKAAAEAKEKEKTEAASKKKDEAPPAAEKQEQEGEKPARNRKKTKPDPEPTVKNPPPPDPGNFDDGYGGLFDPEDYGDGNKEGPGDFREFLKKAMEEDEDLYVEACINLGYSNAVLPRKTELKAQAELYDEILKLKKEGKQQY